MSEGREHAHALAGVAEPVRSPHVAALEESFDAAVAASGGVLERTFEMAGRTLRVRSAGPALLARLTRALAHLEAPGDAPVDLVINVWDTGDGRSLEPPLPHVGGPQAPGSFHYYSDDWMRAAFQPGTNVYLRTREQAGTVATRALSVLEPAQRVAWYWIEDVVQLPWWEEATPLRFILDWWLREVGVYQLHSGAVGTEAGGVLLVGKSGSGKSTSTLACLGSDLVYAGDDYVAVEIGEQLRVHSLYSSGKIEPDHIARLPHLEAAVANARRLDLEKAVVYVNETFASNMTQSFPLRAIVAPRITPGLVEARAVPISRTAGLAALAPSTVFQLHTRGQEILSATGEMAARVPSFRLELGSDVGSVPTALRRLLEELERGEA